MAQPFSSTGLSQQPIQAAAGSGPAEESTTMSNHPQAGSARPTHGASRTGSLPAANPCRTATAAIPHPLHPSDFPTPPLRLASRARQPAPVDPPWQTASQEQRRGRPHELSGLSHLEVRAVRRCSTLTVTYSAGGSGGEATAGIRTTTPISGAGEQLQSLAFPNSSVAAVSAHSVNQRAPLASAGSSDARTQGGPRSTATRTDRGRSSAPIRRRQRCAGASGAGTNTNTPIKETR